MTRTVRTARTRRLGLWMLAVVVLVLALALAACGGRGGALQGSSAANNVTTQQSTGSGGASDIQGADQQIQSALQGLDSAQSDANQDFSSQDVETVP